MEVADLMILCLCPFFYHLSLAVSFINLNHSKAGELMFGVRNSHEEGVYLTSSCRVLS